jgi:hypothetical protein
MEKKEDFNPLKIEEDRIARRESRKQEILKIVEDRFKTIEERFEKLGIDKNKKSNLINKLRDKHAKLVEESKKRRGIV